MVAIRNVGVRFRRQDGAEGFNLIRRGDQPDAVPVLNFIAGLEITRPGVRVILHRTQQVIVGIVDGKIDGPNDRLGGLDEVRTPPGFLFADSFVADDDPVWGCVRADVISGHHATEPDLAHARARRIHDLVEKDDSLRHAGRRTLPELLHRSCRQSQRFRRSVAQHLFGNTSVAVRHGDSQDTLRLPLEQVPDFAVVLELVVVRAAKSLGGPRINWDQSVTDRIDSDHLKGRDPA